CSMTAFETSETFLMFRTPPTDPARRVGPCMQHASSSTTPSSFGSPPSPTLSSLGSSSGPLTTRSAASSVSPPSLRKAKASSRYLTPFLAQMMIGLLPVPNGVAAPGASPLEWSCAFRPEATDAAIAEPINPRRLIDIKFSLLGERRKEYHGSEQPEHDSPARRLAQPNPKGARCHSVRLSESGEDSILQPRSGGIRKPGTEVPGSRKRKQSSPARDGTGATTHTPSACPRVQTPTTCSTRATPSRKSPGSVIRLSTRCPSPAKS